MEQFHHTIKVLTEFAETHKITRLENRPGHWEINASGLDYRGFQKVMNALERRDHLKIVSQAFADESSYWAHVREI